MMQGKRMTGGTLFTVWGHDTELTERLAGLLKHAQSLGENTVVVAEKNAHQIG